MATQVFRYVIHKVGIRKPLQRGEVRKKTLEQAIKTLQRRIKKAVTKQHMQLYMKVWNADDATEKFGKQYDDKKDFKTLRKPAKWRKTLSRKIKYGHKVITPMYWFVALGKKGQVDLTRLAYEPGKGTLLKRKRKRLYGPFQDEATAIAFRDKALAFREGQRNTEFKQHLRRSGPIADEI